jgi:heme/copper-type cytochrome/quinol oxidase subunit 2
MLFFFKKYIFYFIAMIYDASVESQLTFQRPATLIMEEIIELHHDIFSLLLFLCTLVFYLLFIIVYKFSSTNLKVKRDFFFKSQATLEII